MIPAIARFVEALRDAGVPASPAEVLDAARAVEVLGIERRDRFRAALAASLAKTRRDLATFDRLFDRFFATPARGGGKERSGRGGAGAPEGRPRPGAPRDDSRGRRPSELEKKLPGNRPARAPREGRLRRERRHERPRGDEARESRERSESPRKADLARPMDMAEERRLAAEVPKIVEELRLRAGRRLRRSRRGRPWMRAAFRESAPHGGVPFAIPVRRPRPRRTRVVLLVDVSWSVARAAGYFLWMASAFARPGRRTRVLAFVDRPVDATDAVSRWSRGRRPGGFAAPVPPAGGRRGRVPGEGIVRGGTSFAAVLRSLPGLDLDAPSDYGRALHALLRSHLRPRGRDTVLVVLGDGRTNRFDPLPWALEEIARGCRAVLWLVPEPRSRWGTADSALASYLRSVDVVSEATDLDGLAEGVAELARRL